jgi:hypothetical protein
VFHVELRRFPHSARAFNLSERELVTRVLEPWLQGEEFEFAERRWNPTRCDLQILEGERLRPDELSIGRGWQNALRSASDVTERMLTMGAAVREAAAGTAAASETFPRRPFLTIPFELRESDGVVAVHYGANEDPARWGMQYLGIATAEQLHLATGYPVLLATVEFSAEGFAAELQWIQLVTTWVEDAQPEVMCDTAPQMDGVAMPFMSFGVRPVLFDAPARIEPGLSWRAESFLTYTPDVLMTKVIAPVWIRAREHLADMHPEWRFEDAGPWPGGHVPAAG